MLMKDAEFVVGKLETVILNQAHYSTPRAALSMRLSERKRRFSHALYKDYNKMGLEFKRQGKIKYRRACLRTYLHDIQ